MSLATSTLNLCLLTLRRSYGPLDLKQPLPPLLKDHLPKGSALCTSSGGKLGRIQHIVHACACDDAGASDQLFGKALANSLRLAAGASHPSRARHLCLGVLSLLL